MKRAPFSSGARLVALSSDWRRLRDVAEKITETEVRLHLPNQTTPKGRRFNIEGVVDIVQEGERTIMYDLRRESDQRVRKAISEFGKRSAS
jgi:hypothetical protein